MIINHAILMIGYITSKNRIEPTPVCESANNHGWEMCTIHQITIQDVTRYNICIHMHWKGIVSQTITWDVTQGERFSMDFRNKIFPTILLFDRAKWRSNTSRLIYPSHCSLWITQKEFNYVMLIYIICVFVWHYVEYAKIGWMIIVFSLSTWPCHELKCPIVRQPISQNLQHESPKWSKMKPIGTPCQEHHASSLLEACFSETLVPWWYPLVN
jgi:hypothetical protein